MKYILMGTLVIFQFLVGPQPQQDMKKLIYVMDPQCGWCYGNSHNMESVYNRFKDSVKIEVVVGGLWLGANAPRGGLQLGQFIEQNAPHMEATTGVKIGEGYYELVKDSTYLFSSLEPCAAIVLVKEILPESAFLFAKDVQKALYSDGKRLDIIDTYIPILEKYAIDQEAFKSQWLSADNLEKTTLEFKQAAELATGFPTLILQSQEDNKVLAPGYFDLEQVTNTITESL